ncbi:hypothetical protein [Nocardia sp. R7R-8]|uniref:hypothetical protein n=1 Tax=Nocardia sp. R7R-8 TaxID=3459304 RepID=UPI00403E0C9B
MPTTPHPTELMCAAVRIGHTRRFGDPREFFTRFSGPAPGRRPSEDRASMV